MNTREIKKAPAYRGYALAKHWVMRLETLDQHKQIIDEAYTYAKNTRTKVNRDRYIRMKLTQTPPIIK